MENEIGEILTDLVRYIERGEKNGRPVHFIGEYVERIEKLSDQRVKRVGEKLMKKATLDPRNQAVSAKEIYSVVRRELGDVDPALSPEELDL